MKNILFLCTGNYYRSRFAEHLFNWYCAKRGLDWVADSRGLAIETGVNNIGAMSRYTVVGLAERGINIPVDERFPQQAKKVDFQLANIIIALDESEHRPLMKQRFPLWIDAVEYWLVHDVDKTAPQQALGAIEKNIHHLIEKLMQR
ncbi:MAG: low molecular weight phosphatase family protein [Nostocaceae cyanobacterium]|nr:low molecular weight phosphatase family protein [Nostocaceae cyanobacterium]